MITFPRFFFLVTRSHDFFLKIFERKKKPDELIVVNESVGTSSTFKAFLNVHTLLYFSFDDFFLCKQSTTNNVLGDNATKVL